MSNANTILAAAIAQGGDKLSPRDCGICLAYSQAAGNTAQQQINGAIAAGLDRLSPQDIWRCIAYTVGLNNTVTVGGIPADTGVKNAIAGGYDGLSGRDIRIGLASLLGVDDPTTLKNGIAAGYDRLSEQDISICILFAISGSPSTVLQTALAAGYDKPSPHDIKLCCLYFWNNLLDPQINVPPYTPVLSVNSSGVFSWTWAGMNPPFWAFQTFPFSSWVTLSTLPGSTKSFTPPQAASSPYRVVGLKSDLMSFATPFSNVINYP